MGNKNTSFNLAHVGARFSVRRLWVWSAYNEIFTGHLRLEINTCWSLCC